MRRFIESTNREIVQSSDVESVTYDYANNEVELTLRSGAKACVDQDEWETVKGLYSYVPASPGIRVLDVSPYRPTIKIGPTVLAWRTGGGGFPIGVSLDCGPEIASNSENVAYLFPDGHVENCDGVWPSLDAYTERFNERRERWLADCKAKQAKADA